MILLLTMTRTTGKEISSFDLALAALAFSALLTGCATAEVQPLDVTYYYLSG